MTSAPCTRVSSIPSDVSLRRWTLRDDNHCHHHGVVRLSESPLYLDLFWRSTKGSVVHPVGLFKLDLHDLLAGSYIRHDRFGTDNNTLRLRIVRDTGGNFFIQIRQGEPSFPMPSVLASS